MGGSGWSERGIEFLANLGFEQKMQTLTLCDAKDLPKISNPNLICSPMRSL